MILRKSYKKRRIFHNIKNMGEGMGEFPPRRQFVDIY